MILLDYSQIALSNIIVQRLNDESMIRHMILNSIRMYNKKYRRMLSNCNFSKMYFNDGFGV